MPARVQLGAVNEAISRAGPRKRVWILGLALENKVWILGPALEINNWILGPALEFSRVDCKHVQLARLTIIL